MAQNTSEFGDRILLEELRESLRLDDWKSGMEFTGSGVEEGGRNFLVTGER
jgi:hypothetical protein